MPPAANNSEGRPSFLSVVATTDDESFVAELEETLAPATELIVVSTQPVRGRRARVLHVVALESSYRRNRGLEDAHGDVVAFVEDGQLPGAGWCAAILEAFEALPRPAAAVLADVPLRTGGNVAYDRARLMELGGFPLFTGAAPGSAVPDLLVLLSLESKRERVARCAGMQLSGKGPSPPRDARLVGRALRARRRPLLALRRAAGDLGKGAPRGVLDLFAGAARDEPPELSGAEQISPVPQTVAAVLGRRTLVPVSGPHKGKLHYLFRADELMVHLYVSPTDHLRAAVAAHIEIARLAVATGIPRVLAWEEEVDCLWLVEDFMPGTPIDGRTLRAAADDVAGWVSALGGPPGPPLASSTNWRAHREELLRAAFPDAARERLASSLDAVQDVRARHLHGDLNPRNVLVDRSRFAAVDWENAALEFLPGLDLVFLFLLADGTPDERAVLAPEPLEPHLHALGVEERLVNDALRVMLATWALGERKRRGRLGVEPGPPVFEALYLRCEAELA